MIIHHHSHRYIHWTQHRHLLCSVHFARFRPPKTRFVRYNGTGTKIPQKTSNAKNKLSPLSYSFSAFKPSFQTKQPRTTRGSLVSALDKPKHNGTNSWSTCIREFASWCSTIRARGSCKWRWQWSQSSNYSSPSNSQSCHPKEEEKADDCLEAYGQTIHWDQISPKTSSVGTKKTNKYHRFVPSFLLT